MTRLLRRIFVTVAVRLVLVAVGAAVAVGGAHLIALAEHWLQDRELEDVFFRRERAHA